MQTISEKFLIQLRASSVKTKPQNQTIELQGKPWEIEWSTHVEIPMEIDYFNLTIGRAIKQENEETENAQPKIEEFWRVTRIPQANRKIIYGTNPSEATSTPAKPLEDGIYIIKITGMTNLAAGLEVMTAVGLAVIKLYLQTKTQTPTPEYTDKESSAETPTAATAPKQEESSTPSPVKLTGKTISTIFDILDKEDKEP